MKGTPSLFDFLEELRQSVDEIDHAIFCTYTIEPSFFEGRILPILQDADAANILCLVDKREYLQKFDEFKTPGVDYYLDYCNCKGIFHPKIILLLWPSGGKLIISSANLTENDWLDAGQLVTSLDYDSKNPNALVAQAFRQVAEFLETASSMKLIPSSEHRLKIQAAIHETAWIKAASVSTEPEKLRISHNLTAPILQTFLKRLGSDRITELVVASPFFDSNASIFKEIANKGCKTIRLHVQPKRVVGFPTQEIETLSKKINIQTISTAFKDYPNRYNHAKLLIFKTKKASYCVTGSANATADALSSTSQTGNIELCVIREESRPTYFDTVLHSGLFSFEKIPTNTLDCVTIPQVALPPSPEISVQDAHIRSGKLIVEFLPIETNGKTMIILSHGPQSATIGALGTITAPGTVELALTKASEIFLSTPAFVQLEIEVKDKALKSDRRWISTELLESRPHRRDAMRIAQSSGRDGLITFLEKLEKLAYNAQWFFHYLQWVNIDDLGDTLDLARRRIMQTEQVVENGSEGSLSEPPEPNVSELVYSILNRYQRKFDKRHEEFDPMDGLKALEKQFDYFIFMNKLVIWLVLTNRVRADELSRIRTNMESLIELANKLEKSSKVRPLMQRLLMPEHFAILAFIVEALQSRSGYIHRSDYREVISVFRDTYSRSLRKLLVPNPPREMFLANLDKAAKSYREFRGLAFDLQQVLGFTLEMLRRIPRPRDDFN